MPAAKQTAHDAGGRCRRTYQTGLPPKISRWESSDRSGPTARPGYVIEYAGQAVRALSMEGRMTLCNMSIEAGARAGMIAPDETTFAYLKGRTVCSGR